MKFQDDISNMKTYIRTSRNQYVPHFFKVSGINIPKSPNLSPNLKRFKSYSRYKKVYSMHPQTHACSKSNMPHNKGHNKAVRSTDVKQNGIASGPDIICVQLAQFPLVELWPCKLRVSGSNPASVTHFLSHKSEVL